MKLNNIKSFYLAFLLLSVICSAQTQKDTLTDKKKIVQKMLEYFNNSSRAFDQGGDLPKALSLYNKGYKLATLIANDSVMAIANMYKAVIDYNNEEFDIANKTFDACLKTFMSIDKEHILIAKIYNYKGILAYHEGHEGYLEKTIQYFEKAYQHYLNSKTKTLSIVSPAYNLAVIYFDDGKGDYKKSKDRMTNALNVYYSLSKKNGKTPDSNDLKYQKMRMHIAMCEMYLGNFNKVKPVINSILKLYRTKKFYSKIKRYHTYRRNYEYKNKNYIEAHKHSDSIIKYMENDFNFFKQKNKKFIKDSENFENMSLKLKLSEKEKELSKQKINSLKWGLGIATIIILSLFAISILLKRKNKTLKILKVQAEEGMAQKSKFIAMISHEVRTPLNALLGFSKLLLEESPKEHQKNHINSLVSSANYLLNLINNVLNLNETENDFIKIEQHNMAMEPFINTIANAFSLQLANNNNKLSVNFDPKIPKRLKSDPTKISQILKNLLNNACKFTEEGQIWLNVTLFENNSDHCMVNFEVKDTGIGIPEDKFNSIFEAFSNDRLDIKKDYDGSGIGLTIVQKLLKAFDSEIILESKLNQGSSFSFVLKMFKPEQEIKASNYSNDNQILKNKNILVVEDNKVNQHLAIKMLKKVKANPTICSNGLIGFETFKSKPNEYFDFVLMDIHMPVMDGYECTKLIKSISPKIPIVALTATNLENTKEVLKEKQLDAVIYKPYEVEHVYETVKTLI